MALDFRYFIVGMKDGMYGIKDLEDGITEFFTYDQVMHIAGKIKIKGVTSRGINVDWFIGHIRAAWRSRKDNLSFITDYGLFFHSTGLNGQLELLSVHGYTDVFMEFVGNFRMLDYDKENDIFTDSDSAMTDRHRNTIMNIMRTVGFNYIYSSNIYDLPLDVLPYFDFDKCSLDSQSLTVLSVSDSVKVVFNNRIKSSRPINLSISCSNIVFERLESESELYISVMCGTFQCSMNFINNIKGSFKVEVGVPIIADTMELTKLVKKGCFSEKTMKRGIIQYLQEGSSAESSCLLIRGTPKDGVIFGYNVNSFIFLKKVSPVLKMTHEKYNMFMEESNFSERHGISKVQFSSIVKFV